ncbi:MAG TPA: DUF2683 domain-containing protein [Candidatus Pacearchaeota archaeon]|nr:DUF2683 domain-containing protein [Candidatus Pacearchaeota archaeon]
MKHSKMVKATIEIPERENRILNIVKGQHGFKNRDQALIFLIQEYEQSLEPELRPEYVKKLTQIDKQKGVPFKSIEELRKLTGE